MSREKWQNRAGKDSRSIVRHLQSAADRLREVGRYPTNLRAEAHLAGHTPDPELCYDGEPLSQHPRFGEVDRDKNPDSEEIVLFERLDKPKL